MAVTNNVLNEREEMNSTLQFHDYDGEGPSNIPYMPPILLLAKVCGSTMLDLSAVIRPQTERS